MPGSDLPLLVLGTIYRLNLPKMCRNMTTTLHLSDRFQGRCARRSRKRLLAPHSSVSVLFTCMHACMHARTCMQASVPVTESVSLFTENS